MHECGRASSFENVSDHTMTDTEDVPEKSETDIDQDVNTAAGDHCGTDWWNWDLSATCAPVSVVLSY